MKTIEKIIALVLAVCLCCGMAVTASASTFTDAHGNVIELDDSLEAYTENVLYGAENAARKAQRCEEAGYPASVFTFKNGLNAVAVCPSDQLGETVRNLKALRGSAICPSDGWILVSD